MTTQQQMTFKKATKASARLRLALIGPPGSGKTWTGLAIATSLGKRVAVIDTERGSASKYADLFDFDVLELNDSFHPQRYVEALEAAAGAGYEVVLVDSLSHAWIGTEGGLDLHDKAVSRQTTKNSYTAWAAVTPHHNALVNALIQTPMHLIATMRSKVDYVQEKDGNGKTTVRKVGTAPLMRDGVEYEFDAVGDMDGDHNLVITKTRCPALDGAVIQKPGKKLAATLSAWLGDGKAAAPPAPQQAEPKTEAPTKAPNKPAWQVFASKLDATDREFAEKGWYAASVLTQEIMHRARQEKFPDDMKDWKAEDLQRAAGWCKEIKQECQRRASAEYEKALAKGAIEGAELPAPTDGPSLAAWASAYNKANSDHFQAGQVAQFLLQNGSMVRPHPFPPVLTDWTEKHVQKAAPWIEDLKNTVAERVHEQQVA